MEKSSLAFLLMVALQSGANGATGNLVVYDDADGAGFSHDGADCTNMAFFNETTVVHGGSAGIAIPKVDTAGAGWLAETSYSASSDYAGISFWINAGDSATEVTSLGVYDASFAGHFLHLEDVLGAALPANTWIHFQIPFSSPFFAFNSYTPPETVKEICIISHNAEGMTKFFYLDEVTLTGADIFKNGFEN